MSMGLDEVREMLNEKKLLSFSAIPEERRIIFRFADDHVMSVRIERHPGCHYEWDESLVIRIDGETVIRV